MLKGRDDLFPILYKFQCAGNPAMFNDPMGNDAGKVVDAPTPPKHHMNEFGDDLQGLTDNSSDPLSVAMLVGQHK
jgi:hypothetical protein